MENQEKDYIVATFYKFVTLEDYKEMKAPLLSVCQSQQIKGTILLAKEGVNSTISGTKNAISEVLSYLRKDPRLSDLEAKFSNNFKKPFLRMKVKLKNEIVTMGKSDIDPLKAVGKYVEAKDWNDLLNDPEVTVIDTRNQYETGIGTFKNAIDPETDTFREFPEYVEKKLDPKKNKKVAMFCTGGIRCEKATSYLVEKGFDEVYHLKGGILKYLEEVPEEESMWEGQCFVFDDRVAVDQNLKKGIYEQCYGCRMPITEEDMKSPHYLKGVHCHHCIDNKSDKSKARSAERQKQIDLAKGRNETHIGSDS